MSYAILTDPHIGLKRKAGVTKASLKKFHDHQLYIIKRFLELVPYGTEKIFLGDIFDGGDVDIEFVIAVHRLLREEDDITLVAGNHDLNKNTEKMSAFDLLCYMLPQAGIVKELKVYADGLAILPHVPNQEEFNKCVEFAAKVEVSTLLAHCNYDNHFAVQLDHSLNLSAEQAEMFDHVILGHEHNKRDLPGVDILGCPLPCRIDECSVPKGYHLWEGPGHELEFVETWSPEACVSIDWKDLDHLPPDIDYVKVTGNASKSEGAEVVSAIDDFRKNTDVYIVTNYVEVEGEDFGELEEMTDRKLSEFNTLEELKGVLPDKYHEKLTNLIEEGT